MRALIQRVIKSSVTIDGKVFSSIGKGMMILLGVQKEIPQSKQNIWQKKWQIYVFLKTKKEK